MAEKMIAYCGLDCAACPAFMASGRLTMEERQKVADKWSAEFKTGFQATDIDCVGCNAREGVHIGHCSVCEIRLCGVGKGFLTCVECPEFACAKLEGFFKMAPQAKPNLTALRAG